MKALPGATWLNSLKKIHGLERKKLRFHLFGVWHGEHRTDLSLLDPETVKKRLENEKNISVEKLKKRKLERVKELRKILGKIRDPETRKEIEDKIREIKTHWGIENGE